MKTSDGYPKGHPRHGDTYCKHCGGAPGACRCAERYDLRSALLTANPRATVLLFVKEWDTIIELLSLDKSNVTALNLANEIKYQKENQK